jgi:predicted Ser/Thr protein kinase
MENLQQAIETTREFKIQQLEHITNNFSEEHVIGRGGYGVVYKVKLLITSFILFFQMILPLST